MQKSLSFKSLKARTVQNKFNIIISLIILILLFGLVNFWFGMKIMSGIRAYVGGEGLWSKAQKEATSNLIKYSDSRQESDFNNYLRFTQVQLGDKQARLELDKPHPNLDVVVREGFVKGGNDPRDVNNLVFLYRRFRHVSYMNSAIQTWTQGDQEISKLMSIGAQMHRVVSATVPANDAKAQAVKASQIAALRKQIYESDSRLTVLENQFSATLSDGSRNINNALVRVTLISTILLGVLTLSAAILIAKAIIRLDKLKSGFVSLASHQLRTPLTAINWNGEMLLSESAGKLNKNQKRYLTDLYDGGQRMAEMIRELLKVSNLDLGTYTSEVKLVDVSGVLKTIIKDQQFEIDQKGISLTTAVGSGLTHMQLDEQLVTMIFQNLVSNSVKYTRKGGRIDISVTAKRRNLLIKVSDNGIGIPEAQQPQIFAKLFRADNAEKLITSGTGLGLYIVKATLDRTGGTIWFDSIENQGSNFYVKIPL